MDDRTYTKAGILAGAERWGQVLRDFLDSGEELEELDPANFGAHGESEIQGLADALGFSALAVGLGEEVLVDIFEGSVMLVRRDAIERHRADAGPPDDEDLGDVEMFTEMIGGFLESDALRWTMGGAGSAQATMLYVRRLAMAAEDLGVMDRIAISIDGDSIVLSRND